MQVHNVFPPDQINSHYGRSSKMGMNKSGLVASVSVADPVSGSTAVYFKVSTDFGATWGDTKILDSGLWLGGADIKVDEKGVIYVAIADFAGYLTQESANFGFYWMYSEDQGNTWTKSAVHACPGGWDSYSEDLVIDVYGSVKTNDLRLVVGGVQGPPTYIWASDQGWIRLQGEQDYTWQSPYPHGPGYGTSVLTSSANRGTIVTVGGGQIDYANSQDAFWTIVFRNGSPVFQTPPNVTWLSGWDAFQQSVVRNTGTTWAITTTALYADGDSGYDNDGYWQLEGRQAAVLLSFDDGQSWQRIGVDGCIAANSEFYAYRFLDILNDQIIFGYEPRVGTIKFFAGRINRAQKSVQWQQIYSTPAIGESPLVF